MEQIRLGVAGLGRAFMLMLPTLVQHPRVRLVAATDPRADALDRFRADFAGARTHPSVEALCDDPAIDAVYISTPHQFHLAHVQAAAARRKHVLVEKPMALNLAEAQAMVEAARAAGIHLLVGHSHSFDAPYLRARDLIRSGSYGALRMITALNFTDYLYRPRRPEELDTAQGGGAVFSQAPHQVEIARLLADHPARSVRASTSVWDRARGTEGAYAAFLDFGEGLTAALTYSGHGHFDSDAFMGWTGEMGFRRDPDRHGEARAALARLASPAEEAALKSRRAYGAALGAEEARGAPPPSAHNHFGLFIASCEGADLRPMPDGVMIHGDAERRFETLPPPAVARAEVIDELWEAIALGRAPWHSGASGMATLEICLGILDSARQGREIPLHHQGVPATCR
ncbi:Gfo/Idh/MocA family protein [Falsiroseomonas sp. HC035]|uniref:Gfo/Idh/MocA family protein n=1 Tax=Falsiroseomonas sp. HC035 TaxID=3390999 RepID=UPI003D318EE6